MIALLLLILHMLIMVPSYSFLHYTYHRKSLTMRNMHHFLRKTNLNCVTINKIGTSSEPVKILHKSNQFGYIQSIKKGWYHILLENRSNDTSQQIIKARSSDFTIIQNESISSSILNRNDDIKSIKNMDEVRDKKVITNSRIGSISTHVEIKVPLQVEESIVTENVECISKDPLVNFVDASEYPHHEKEKWIIFSDLHVKSTSIDTCEEVLQRVHDEALQIDAGIIFLGDFWHVRGALNVDLLNRVLAVLSSWIQPVIMIPGNHDQVTLGGNIHALQPLVYAFQKRKGPSGKYQILLFSEPTVCMGAMWIPYRRDSGLMQKLLHFAKNNSMITKPNDSQEAQHKPLAISTIYCHVDVKDAFMNDGFRSREGIDLSLFPSDMPIFSGHFHKPHTITKQSTQLRYVGSPYQTALSEAGQEKYFHVMNCIKSVNPSHQPKSPLSMDWGYIWKEDKVLPLSIGRKYFRLKSGSDPLIEQMRKGDYAVVPIKSQLGSNFEAEQIMKKLNERGIDVELRPERDPATNLSSIARRKETNSKRIQSDLDISELEPTSIFQLYMNQLHSQLVESSTEKDRPIINQSILNSIITIPTSEIDGLLNDTQSHQLQLLDIVMTEGQKILDKVIGMDDATSLNTSNNMLTSKISKQNYTHEKSHREIKNLVFEKVVLENFGPYGEGVVEYPLSKRGLVLIRGKCTDDTGADSNGSGKTTLAMSVMWAMTGSLDSRLIGDGKAADVAYDLDAKLVKSSGTSNTLQSKRIAKVTVTGTINNIPFEVTRRRGPKKSDLLFSLDGTSLTRQSTKDTQEVIDQTLGVGQGLLERCCFFGQHSHTTQSLLGASDVKLKAEMSSIINIDTWTKAYNEVKQMEKRDKAKLIELQVAVKLLHVDEKELSLKLQSSVNTNEQWLKELNKAKSKFDEEMRNFTNYFADKYQNKTSLEMSNEIRMSQDELKRYQDEVYEPCEQRLDRLLNQRFHGGGNGGVHDPLDQEKGEDDSEKKRSRMEFLDQQLGLMRDQVAQIRGSLIASNQMWDQLTNQLNVTTDRMNQLKKELKEMNQKVIPLSDGKNKSKKTMMMEKEIEDNWSPLEVNVMDYRVHLEGIQLDGKAIDEKLLNVKKSLEALQQWNQSSEALMMRMEQEEEGHGHDHVDENCPTCGQMMAVSRQSRMFDLNHEWVELEGQRKRVSEQVEIWQVQYDLVWKMKEKNEELKELQVNVKNLKSELKKLGKMKFGNSQELQDVNEKLVGMEKEKLELERDLYEMEEETRLELRKMKEKLKNMQKKENELKELFVQMKKDESDRERLRLSSLNSISLIDQRLVMTRESLQLEEEKMSKIKETAQQHDLEKKEISYRNQILDKLAIIFGTRGIQNFIFCNVIEQLQDIANNYLNVLAQGGIRLTLQLNEDEPDRILKSVQIRNDIQSIRNVQDMAGHEYFRDRALSQLSGGQWRRVSLALDLAYVEVVRRKGLLRSSLIVLDEVLNHLDASGREAVGTVLRAMVTAHLDQTGSNLDESHSEEWTEYSELLGAGVYGTVIVILQDLTSAELEEAFDHIDLVVKNRACAKVIVDGGFPILPTESSKY